jgi:16S rRNA (adenine1518-N6/adenine1519-N6)-dimethyltransferase
MSLRERTLTLLMKYGLEPDPSRDEQQLVDEEAVARLVASSGVEAGDVVVEVGPGLGNITEQLLRVSGRLVAVEKNPKYVPVLLGRFPGATNLEIVLGDALRMDYPMHDRFVSNLPYMISEAMLHRLPRLVFKKAALIVSEGFGERVTAPMGVAGYTKLSYFSQLFYATSHVDTVPPEAYIPEPDTSTWIITLQPTEPEEPARLVMRSLLLQGDRLVKNALREALIRARICETKREARSMLARLRVPDRVWVKSVSRLSLRELLELEENLALSLR